MASKRGSSGLSFLAGVYKPAGMTSHDVVNKVRRATGERRVGHAGTLDPFATGVMMMLVGPATRLSAYLVNHNKTYVAHIVFGSETTTDDVEGEIIRTSEVSSELLSDVYARSILDTFLGKSMQVPCTYSAIKQSGKKAYERARQGQEVQLDAREIEVYDYTLIKIDADGDQVFWDVAFHVSKGTYIRALARDIGRAAKSAAHLGGLERISVGDIGRAECSTVESFEHGSFCILDPVSILGYPEIRVSGDMQKRITSGNVIAYNETFGVFDDGDMVCFTTADMLLAIYVFQKHKAVFKADCVFSQGVARG